MAIDKRSLKKMFPNLAKELEEGDAKISINSIQDISCDDTQASCDKLSNYNPTVIDFLRRCDTEDQAKSIIAYMEKRQEISTAYANQLRQQLHKEGIKSFGPKKEHDFYFKEGGLG